MIKGNSMLLRSSNSPESSELLVVMGGIFLRIFFVLCSLGGHPTEYTLVV